MDTILFINQSYIADNSEVQNDVEIKKIYKSLKFVQKTYIQQMLGTDLYEDLQAEIKAYSTSGTSMTASYTVLLEEFIQPIVLNYAIFKALPHLQYTITNRSVVTKNSDNTDSIDLDVLKFLQNEYKSQADQLVNQAILYILRERQNGNFDKYLTNNEIDDMIPNRNNRVDYGGIYLGEEI